MNSIPWGIVSSSGVTYARRCRRRAFAPASTSRRAFAPSGVCPGDRGRGEEKKSEGDVEEEDEEGGARG